MPESKVTKRTILAILQEACLMHGLDFRINYSGRFMYGATCPGVVTNSPADFAFALAEAVENYPFKVRDVRNALGPDRQDDMGKSIIIYWPDWVGASEPAPVLQPQSPWGKLYPSQTG